VLPYLFSQDHPTAGITGAIEAPPFIASAFMPWLCESHDLLASL